MIPIIDLLNDPPARQADLIKQALGTVGFFEVRNASLSAQHIDTMFTSMRELFDLAPGDKAEYPADDVGSGYIPPRAQALGLEKRDHRETFQYGRNAAKRAQPLPYPWKANTHATKGLSDFHRDLHHISERLLELFALALELPFEHFRKAHSFGLNTGLSMIHYPSLTAEERNGVASIDIRAGEHKDWGTLTMLFQKPGGEPGLQVYLPRSALSSDSTSSPGTDTVNNSEYPTQGDWAWYDAPVPPPGGFLVNVGLAMELWSGGAYKATLHRVIFPQPSTHHAERLPDRYTFAYFVQPDDEVEIQPVLQDGKVDLSVSAIRAGELFGSKLRESMERSKRMHMLPASLTARQDGLGSEGVLV
ncbi:MAG: hypothetical protein TREMPRED_005736 [Tremellales sp. Tagirdzhanova-0007]|nr:MAG: hypothetical protein TREMPRED_005736 [Tremellales sp. Tagirdzhanova-0007]